MAGELGDLPPALAQAAAVISRGRHHSFPAYLEELRQVPVADLLGPVPGGDYPEPTAAALLLSVRAAERADRSALTGQLLRVVAMLSPDGVPGAYWAASALAAGGGRAGMSPARSSGAWQARC